LRFSLIFVFFAETAQILCLSGFEALSTFASSAKVQASFQIMMTPQPTKGGKQYDKKVLGFLFCSAYQPAH